MAYPGTSRRIATEADAPRLAKLVNWAGDGLPLHVWRGLANDGRDPWVIGRERQAEKAHEGKIIVVVDDDDAAIAELTGYVIGPNAQPVDDDVPVLFVPLMELENQALNSWHVNVLACYPEYRGRGIGSALLKHAETIARAAGQGRISVIVADNNDGARRLYGRQGYRQVARRDCVPGTWQTRISEWLLLVKDL